LPSFIELEPRKVVFLLRSAIEGPLDEPLAGDSAALPLEL